MLYSSLMKATTVRDIAAIVRDRRKALAWTQAELASRLGVGREWVIQFEHGKSTAEWGIVVRAFRELGFSLDLGVDEARSGIGADDLDQILAATTRPRKAP
jgi:transcriptional regulator with XRE-family HTH domain